MIFVIPSTASAAKHTIRTRHFTVKESEGYLVLLLNTGAFADLSYAEVLHRGVKG